MTTHKTSGPATEAGNSTREILLKARIRHTRIFCLLLVPLVAVTSPRWQVHTLPYEIMTFWGHLFVAGGVLIRIYSSLFIGGRKNEMLITEGPFSVVRNPLYLGSFLAMSGLVLLTGSITFTGVLLAAFLLYYRITVMREEIFLHRKFGARYRKYVERVPRWLPERNLWMLPAQSRWNGQREMNVRPYFVLRAALDGSVFFLIIPLLEGLCALREHGVVPTLLNLP
ncbi:methyltransferase family protein [Singulisphaera rosea]